MVLSIDYDPKREMWLVRDSSSGAKHAMTEGFLFQMMADYRDRVIRANGSVNTRFGVWERMKKNLKELEEYVKEEAKKQWSE